MMLEKKSTDALDLMLELIKSGDPEALNQIATLRKKALYVRDDILGNFIEWCDRNDVKYISAYMEAEWELCKLAKDKVIDCVLSEDSDLWAIGAQVVVQMLDLHADSSKESNCTILKSDTMYNYMNNIIEEPTRSEIADYCVLLGCDYIDRPYGNTVKKVTEFFKLWRTQKNTFLYNIQDNGQISGKRSRNGGFPSYIDTFQKASNIFQYAPVFVILSLTSNQSIRDAFWNNEFSVCRGNIDELPQGINELTLFGFDPNIVVPITIEPIKYFNMTVWIRTALPICESLIQSPRNKDNQILPWGCHLDFTKVPPHMQPEIALMTSLECRGLSTRHSTGRIQLIDAVKRVINQGEAGPGIIPSINIKGVGHYITLEVLTCEAPLNWDKNGQRVIEQIKDVEIRFDEDFILKYFGDGRNGVRRRAWGRIVGGHFDLKTLQSTECKCLTNNGIEDVYIFSIKCSPSMKKEVYPIYLIFKKSDNQFLQAPASRCNCPAGRLFCSHMLGFIVLLSMIQDTNENEDYDWLLSNMPDPVKSLHSICLPFKYMF
jgi:hypothetical protein